MNKVNDYLHSLIEGFPTYILTKEDQRAFDLGQKALWITNKLLLKKFRKTSVAEYTRKDIYNKVVLSLKGNKPLHFTIPFGAYKHFWNPSHPEPDWAEVFTLKFLTDWVTPVLAAHKPGVVIEFISEGLIVPRMDNYPPEAMESYQKAFRKLLEFYKKFIKGNLDMSFFSIGDRYDKEKIIKQVEELLPERRQAFEKLSKEEKEVELKRARRALFWNGWKDLTKLSEKEKEERMIESRLIELAYYDIEAKEEFLGDYFNRDNHIGLMFSFGLSPDNANDPWLALGTTYNSSVDFWIGRGILEQRGESFIPRIVSHNQYDSVKDKLKKEGVDKVPLRNLEEIEVYEGVLKFNS